MANTVRKAGKRGRKVGRGKRKVGKSKWGSYAGVIGHSMAMKIARVKKRQARLDKLAAKRKCRVCNSVGFRAKRALRRCRHDKAQT